MFEKGPRAIYVGFPSLGFGVGGRSEANLLASTALVPLNVILPPGLLNMVRRVWSVVLFLIWVVVNIRCRTILRTPNRTIILTTTPTMTMRQGFCLRFHDFLGPTTEATHEALLPDLVTLGAAVNAFSARTLWQGCVSLLCCGWQ